MIGNLKSLIGAINTVGEKIAILSDAFTSSVRGQMDVYTDATRPAANTKPAGYCFFNSSDNFINCSDGTNWRNQSGATT